MFFAFGIKDFIDILLVALLLYYTYKLMKASGSLNIFIGILVFILIWLVVSQVLEMKLLGSAHHTLSRRDTPLPLDPGLAPAHQALCPFLYGE